MSTVQLSSVLLIFVIFIVSVTSTDIILYHTIKDLSNEAFIGKDTQDVHFLDLRNCKIETVASNSFTGMSKLQTLLFIHNNISSLPEDVFNGLEEFTNLYMDSNKMENIPKKLFANVPKLREINLAHNLISNIEPGAFDNNMQLTRLYLQFNRLETIPEGLFNKLTELVHLDISTNFITYIHNNALPNNANLQELHIHANNLRYVNETLANNLNRFTLDNNPWQCDCRIKELHAKWAEKFQSNGWTPVCAGPTAKYNIRWDFLSANDFECKDEIVTLYPDVLEIPVLTGDNVTVSCRVSGKESLQAVKFTYGNDTEVTNQLQMYDHPFGIQFSSIENGFWYNLTVFNIRKIDDGTYKCVLRNEHETQIKIRVE